MNAVSSRFARIPTFVITAALALVYVFVGTPLVAQEARWTSHTSMREVSDIDASGTRVWTATSGGVFSFEVATGEIKTYTVVDGLHAVNVRTIGVDDSGENVWLGYGDGVLDRIQTNSGKISNYRDIARATQFSARGINRIQVTDDSLLIATEFGIVIFDPIKTEVRDSYTRLGDNPPATEVFDIALGPNESNEMSFWAGTVNGVARASLATGNLQDPSAWQIERAGFEPGSEEVRALLFFNGSLHIGTSLDAYRRGGGGVYERLQLTPRPVTDFAISGNQMIGVERFALLGFNTSGQAWTFGVDGFQDPISVASSAGTGLFFGDVAHGLVSLPEPDISVPTMNANFTVVPAGPHEGLFSDLDIDADGNLWAGGSSAPTSGFYHLSPEREWTSFSNLFYPELLDRNRFTRIHVHSDGTGWAGSEGSGVASASVDGIVTTYDQSNSTLLEATGTNNFIIVGGLYSDASGTVWVTTRGSGMPLHARETDGTWHGFGPFIGNGLTNRSTAFGRIFVDSFDQKWIILRDENNFQNTKGLLVVDTGDVASATDDTFHFFGSTGSAGQGLPSVAVLSVAEDRDGLVWIGTASGPAYFVNTGIISEDESARAIWPQWADRSQGTFMLFGLKINDVAVDPANQLWFGTNDGAWLVRSVEGGYETVYHFTAENSPLFSDEVLSVAVDGKTGDVFFSTSQGLISFAGDSVIPVLSAKDLFVYPNPAHFADMSSPNITIEGLVEETDIRILTATGSLVRRISARGGRAQWNGEDESGRLVDSGVYLIVAVGADGSGTAHGKVAVIH